MPGLKPRATTLVDLAASAKFYVAARPLALSEKAVELLDAAARCAIGGSAAGAGSGRGWQRAGPRSRPCATHAEASDLKLGQVAQPLRAALTGSTTSPGLFEVMAVLGRDEALARLADAIEGRTRSRP